MKHGTRSRDKFKGWCLGSVEKECLVMGVVFKLAFFACFEFLLFPGEQAMASCFPFKVFPELRLLRHGKWGFFFSQSDSIAVLWWKVYPPIALKTRHQTRKSIPARMQMKTGRCITSRWSLWVIVWNASTVVPKQSATRKIRLIIEPTTPTRLHPNVLLDRNCLIYL